MVAITATFVAFENPEAYPREIGWGCFHPFGQPFGAVGSISKAAKQGCDTPSWWLVSKTWYIFLLVQRLIIAGYIRLHPDGSWLCMCMMFTCGVLYLHSMKISIVPFYVSEKMNIYLYRIHWTWLEAEGCEKQDLCEWHHSCNTRACRSSWRPEVGKIGLEQRTSPGDAEQLSAAVMRLRCHEFHGRSLGIPRTKRAASKMGRSSNKTADFLLPCLSARRYSL